MLLLDMRVPWEVERTFGLGRLWRLHLCGLPAKRGSVCWALQRGVMCAKSARQQAARRGSLVNGSQQLRSDGNAEMSSNGRVGGEVNRARSPNCDGAALRAAWQRSWQICLETAREGAN